MKERRRHHRTVCRVPACIEQTGLINADQYCRTSNIGMKGVFMPNAPRQPLGKNCKLVIHDNAEDPLRLDAKVSHVSKDGIGFLFTSPRVEECLRLKHLVKPYWDGKDFLEGMMLMLRYSQPSTELKDCLSLTSFLSLYPGVFSKPSGKFNCNQTN